MGVSDYLDLDSLLYRTIAFVLVMTLHDIVQAATAYALGDNTAHQQGRTRFNPFNHLDPLGLVMLLFGPYGWNRPVEISPEALRKKRKLSIFAVYMSGPIFLLLSSVFFWWLYFSIPELSGIDAAPGWLLLMSKGILHYCFICSGVLFILNLLLPLFPMDLGKMLIHVLPGRLPVLLNQYRTMSMIGLAIFLMLPAGQRLLAYLFGLYSQLIMHTYSI